jgi:hypothetical protein
MHRSLSAAVPAQSMVIAHALLNCSVTNCATEHIVYFRQEEQASRLVEAAGAHSELAQMPGPVDTLFGSLRATALARVQTACDDTSSRPHVSLNASQVPHRLQVVVVCMMTGLTS